MSYSDYEAGLARRVEIARPLAEAIQRQFPHVTPEDAARGARCILDDRTVYTALAYDAQVQQVEDVRTVIKAFKGLLDG